MPHPTLTGLSWRKSSRSTANSDCVEVAVTTDLVATRDSKNPTPLLAFSTPAWRTFVRSVTLP